MASNTTNVADIEKLIASVEEKRKLLNQIYEESKVPVNQNTITLNTKQNILIKNVQFDSEDDYEHEKKNTNNKSAATLQHSNMKMNATYDLKKKQSTIKKPSSEVNKSPSSLKTSKKLTPSKSVATIAVANASKIQIKPKITLQQKRQILLENKAILDKQLVDLRVKILTRKFAYLWLRRHFYSKSKIQLLPSQIE
jgi:hypothetical protein